MNLRKGLLAAATALTVSVAGVGVASAETETPIIGSSTSADAKDEDTNKDGDTDGGLSSADDKNKEDGDVELSSQEGIEGMTGVLKFVATAVSTIVGIYTALTTFGIL